MNVFNSLSGLSASSNESLILTMGAATFGMTFGAVGLIKARSWLINAPRVTEMCAPDVFLRLEKFYDNPFNNTLNKWTDDMRAGALAEIELLKHAPQITLKAKLLMGAGALKDSVSGIPKVAGDLVFSVVAVFNIAFDHPKNLLKNIEFGTAYLRDSIVGGVLSYADETINEDPFVAIGGLSTFAIAPEEPLLNAIRMPAKAQKVWGYFETVDYISAPQKLKVCK